ncbi:MAG: nodulation protein NfeD [Bdellovibrionota bacterium]
MLKFILKPVVILLSFLSIGILASAAEPLELGGEHVALIKMDMLILPGTQEYLISTINEAHKTGAKLLIVELDTPGGMLNTTQEMIQKIFSSPIPIVIYVSPTGASATSAGVFLTLAGHVAAMAPGTTIGAAHPVAGDGKDIEGDMRAKTENSTVSMVKAISEQRGRNVEWAEKSVKESLSITEKEAVKKNVVDLVADSVDELLKKLEGRKVQVENKDLILRGVSKLPIKRYQMSFKNEVINVLANPSIAALLWLGATTGISMELYHPGAILPGVVGVICLVLALAVSQVIPITQGGIALLVLGVALIGAELFVPSGIMGIGGVIAIVLGSIYLVDVSEAPGLAVNLKLIVPIALILGLSMLGVVYFVIKAMGRKFETGNEGLVGETGKAGTNISNKGKVFINGEIWNAVSEQGIIEKDALVKVEAVLPGLVLKVTQISEIEI